MTPGAVPPTLLPPWLRAALPAWLKPGLRRALCALADGLDALRGRRGPMVPPAHLRVRVGCFASFIRVGRYEAVGREFVGHLRQLAGLRPDSAVLDIGCGCGQMAAALVDVLGPAGRYDGFDPDAQAIAWCRAHIGAADARLRFAHADLANTQYNPAGHVDAATFRFPYDDAAFDVVLLKSVFTHMPRPQMAHYLREIARMLRPGGCCLASFYLVDQEAREGMAAGRSAYVFQQRGEGCWVLDPRVPDYVVAYDETELAAEVAHAGLAWRPPHGGSWCGRAAALSFQDLVCLQRDG